MRLASLLALLVLLCCVPTARECSFLCEKSGECPGGLACGTDGYCHADNDHTLCSATDVDGGQSGDGATNCVGCIQGGPYNYVFVTSTTHVPGMLGSVLNADQICQARAQAAGLPGTYMAWLSTSTQSASDRIAGKQARGWIRPDHRPFTDSLEKLTQSDQVFYPLRIDEQGSDIAGTNFPILVATGTAKTGATAAGQTCNDWTQTGGTYAAGEATATAVFWTASTPTNCTVEAHLYCFGVDSATPLSLSAEMGRIAFVSQDAFALSSGRPLADAFCQQQAAKFGLATPESFLALLPLSSESAASRLNMSGATWVRTDGVPWMAAASDLVAGKILTALNVDSQGLYGSAISVWAGSADPNALGTQDCNDWTSTSGSVLMGRADVSDPRAFRDPWNNNATCSGPGRLYCLQK